MRLHNTHGDKFARQLGDWFVLHHYAQQSEIQHQQRAEQQAQSDDVNGLDRREYPAASRR